MNNCYMTRNGKEVFSILSTNIQSINAKLMNLKRFVEYLKILDFQFSAICIQESWLSVGDDTSQIQLEGYKCIPQAKNELYTTLINESKNNSKILLGCMNELSPKDSKQTSSSLLVDVHKITDPLEVANSFNNFFTSIVQTYIPSNEPLDMFSIPIMLEDQVLTFIGDLDETKTTEWMEYQQN